MTSLDTVIAPSPPDSLAASGLGAGAGSGGRNGAPSGRGRGRPAATPSIDTDNAAEPAAGRAAATRHGLDITA